MKEDMILWICLMYMTTIVSGTDYTCGGGYVTTAQCNNGACANGAFKCENGFCCPMRFNQDYKCEGTDVRTTTQCENGACANGAFKCENGYCCPMRFNQDYKCQGTDVRTTTKCNNGACSNGAYKCENGYCCPMRFNQDYTCQRTNVKTTTKCENGACSNGAFKCENGYCCPMRFNQVYSCEGTDVKTTTKCDNGACANEAFKCENDYCCPMRFNKGNHTGKCPSFNKMVGICIGKKDIKCRNDTDCQNGDLCCRNKCGTFCTPPENKTPCQEELQSAYFQLMSTVGSCIPVFIPRCDRNGNYHRTQCYDHIGLCFCVDPSGTKIEGTEVRGNPDCSRATKTGVCPHFSTLPPLDLRCSETCKTDDSCTGDKKCCFNGCGYHCMGPVGNESPTTRKRRNANNRSCTFDALFQPDNECSSTKTCPPGSNTECDANTGWCCPPVTANKGDNTGCSSGFQNAIPCQDGTCRGGFMCESGLCCPMRVNSLTPSAKHTCTVTGIVTSEMCNNGQCSNGAYRCEEGFCCPSRFNEVTEYTCQGSDVRTTAKCQEGACANGALKCENGFCCPMRFNLDYICQGTDVRTTTKCENGACANGAYKCENGYCCPMRFNKEYTCQGTDVKTTTKCNNGACANEAYKCENGFCCPIRFNQGTICIYRRYLDTTVTYVGSVATGSMPSVEACKAACDRDTISDCIGVVYQKNNNGRCTKYSDKTHLTKVPMADSEFYERLCQITAGLCPNQTSVLMSEGVPKTCHVDRDCDVNSFACINGHCCPKSDDQSTSTPEKKCRNNLDPVQDINGKTKSCKSANDCGVPATCQSNICCPGPKQTGLCPNNALPLMEDGTPKSCMGLLQTECGNSGVYTCQGFGNKKYCCPNKVSKDDVCQNKGIPLKNQHGSPKRCTSTMDCGGSAYSCQTSEMDGFKYCCPAKMNFTEMCPNKGYVMIFEGQPKRCTLDAECMTTSKGKYSCVKNYCCPSEINKSECPHNGLALKTDGQPRICTDNIECTGYRKGAYYCNHGYCCPQQTVKGICPNQGMVKLTEDNKPTKCIHNSDCGSASYSCQGGYCCPQKYNSVCPNGAFPMCCKMDLCLHQSCPSNPLAKCRINPCGGCKVEFYDAKNTKVDCTTGLTRCEKMRKNALEVEAFWLDTTIGSRQLLDEVEQEVEPKPKPALRSVSGKSGECLGMKPSQISSMVKDCTSDDDCSGFSKCCLDRCQVPIYVSSKLNDCSKPPVTGPCKASIVRYFYNTSSLQCEEFVYGGCQGNQNNFITKESCERGCSEEGLASQCLLEPVTGRCRAHIPMYFYNVTSHRCEKFVYGGCDGNRNRFSTLEQCFSTCSSKRVPSAPCETKKCPADTLCVAISDTEAKCVSGSNPPLFKGIFVPDCMEDGSFAEMQCQGSLCWCVDDVGMMKPNTLRLGKPPCFKTVGLTKPDEVSSVPVCKNGMTPELCTETCKNATCNGRKDITCIADPCDKCRVSFHNINNKPVQCNVDRCTVQKPAKSKLDELGCGNPVQRWFYNKESKECEDFTFSPCDGDDVYHESEWECRSKCKGIMCQGGGPKTCTTKCSNKKCHRFPSAQCRIHPCTCEVLFFDLVTNKQVNCKSVAPICQLRRSQEKLKALMQEEGGYKVMKDVVISQCNKRGEFMPQQCDKQKKSCWCVDGLGKKIMGTEKNNAVPSMDIGCKENKTVSAKVSLKFKMDYDVYVKGKEDALKHVVLEKLKEISAVMAKHVKEIKIRKGSVIVDIEFTGQPSGADSQDVGSFVNTIESEVSSGFDIRFEGVTMTAEPEVETNLTFQAQTQDPVNKSPTSDSKDSEQQTTIIVVVFLICIVAILVIIAAIFIIKKRKSKQTKDFSNIENATEERSLKQNHMYFNNGACDK